MYIQDTVNSHSATLNQMWVKEDEWIDTLQWQEEDAREEFEDLRIPMDKRGADIMYSVIAPEPKFQAGLIYQAATIMHAAGIDWTMPSMPGWDNSNMAMFTGDSEISGRIARTFLRRRPPWGQKDRHGRVRPCLPVHLRCGKSMGIMGHATL